MVIVLSPEGELSILPFQSATDWSLGSIRKDSDVSVQSLHNLSRANAIQRTLQYCLALQKSEDKYLPKLLATALSLPLGVWLAGRSGSYLLRSC